MSGPEGTLDPPIGYIRPKDAIRQMKQNAPADIDFEQLIAEGCECGKIEAGYRNYFAGADALDPAVWRSPQWRRLFEGWIEIDLPLVDVNGKPNCDGLTTRCQREVFLRKDMFTAFLQELRLDGPKSKAGRKRSYDRDHLEKRIFELMDYHGDFAPSDRAWSAQARLEEKIIEETGISIGQLRKLVPGTLRRWRQKKGGS